MSLQRAKDLESLEIDLELFQMPTYNQVRPLFDVRKFYCHLISFNEEDLDTRVLDIEAAQSRLFEINKRIR
jgi:hypothetical protein